MDSWCFAIACSVLICIQTAGAQKTYLRTCDCQYIQDGKCAYTLMIPLTNQSPAVCPMGESSTTSPAQSLGISEAELQTLNATIADLKNVQNGIMGNISMISYARMEEIAMLARLQSKVMEHSDQINKLMQALVEIGTTVNMTMEMNNTCELCPLLNGTIAMLQNYSHVTREMVVMNQERLSSLELKLENVTNIVQQHQSSVSVIADNAGAIRMDVEMLRTMVRMLPSNYSLCRQKGLIVAGNLSTGNDSTIITTSSANNSESTVSLLAENGTDIWCAGYPNAAREWIQYDLGTPRPVYGIATKGRYDFAQWVTTYSVQYINNLQDPQGWKYYQDILGTTMVFPGNSDQNTLQTNMLWQPLVTRYIRIVALSAVGNMCMRADLIGCVDP